MVLYISNPACTWHQLFLSHTVHLPLWMVNMQSCMHHLVFAHILTFLMAYIQSCMHLIRAFSLTHYTHHCNSVYSYIQSCMHFAPGYSLIYTHHSDGVYPILHALGVGRRYLCAYLSVPANYSEPVRARFELWHTLHQRVGIDNQRALQNNQIKLHQVQSNVRDQMY